MTLPFGLGSLPLPEWLPWWVPAVLLIPALIYALLVLIVPFGVFGLKARLDAIEAQLDDIRADLRALARQGIAAEPYVAPQPTVLRRADPVEPAAERVRLVTSAPRPVPAPRPDSRPPQRAEPRFEAR